MADIPSSLQHLHIVCRPSLICIYKVSLVDRGLPSPAIYLWHPTVGLRQGTDHPFMQLSVWKCDTTQL